MQFTDDQSLMIFCSFPLGVSSINSAPNITYSGPDSVELSQFISFEPFTVSDVDAGNGSFLVTIEAQAGNVTCSNDTSVQSVKWISVHPPATFLQFSSDLAGVNNVLSSLDFIAWQSVIELGTNLYMNVTVSDQGFTGTDGQKNDTISVILVNPFPTSSTICGSYNICAICAVDQPPSCSACSPSSPWRYVLLLLVPFPILIC